MRSSLDTLASSRGAPRPAPHQALKLALDQAMTGLEVHIARDPIRFPRRYLGSPRDVEIAAVFASQLAFGRVDLFGPVLERLFAEMDTVGGPTAWIQGCPTGARDEGDPLVYRWFTRRDFVALGATLAAFPGGIAPLFTDLESGVTALSERAGIGGGSFFRTWFCRPSQGSACKRWCMFLRWMVRTDPPDLGAWRHLSPADLIMPVDTHVLKIARLTGLTDRKTADWKTALQITERLRAFAPEDPVRYDFALAHLGISGGCTGAVSVACEGCALKPVCVVHRA